MQLPGAVNEDAAVGNLAERRIHKVVNEFSRARKLTFESCLDVGCGRSRHDRWFERFPARRPPGRYIGLETDPKIIDELQREGVDARHAIDDPGECDSDLVLCVEVIEHLLPEETPDFLSFVAENTTKLLALTTPNFEYWNGLRQKPEYRECRWIPDHFPFFNPAGGPHAHKQAMTPHHLHAYFTHAFPAPEWEFRVFRAWPWRLEDQVTHQAFVLYFKLFGLAWRMDEVGGGAPL